MIEKGFKNPSADVSIKGFKDVLKVNWNLSPQELSGIAVEKGMGELADNGALVVKTGEFTGRSPKDRFIVQDNLTKDVVDWGAVNIPFDEAKYDLLYNKVVGYFEGKEMYVRDAYACAHDEHRLNIRVYTELPWSNLFASNLFLRPTKDEIMNMQPEWSIICAPGFNSRGEEDGTRQHNFAVINFTKKEIIIGGTAYTGEIKKGIFSVLNFILPHKKDVLSMHCSSNVGEDGDTAVFFGLSGTGKTTLSADPNRALIGDDEHGWADDGIFNFEGGCYAKCINLSAENEPQIFGAIKEGSLVENTKFFKGTNKIDFEDGTITENTRVSYPIEFIDNALIPSMGGLPDNIFFLTCDAFGVLPPISKLSPGQAMYQFISGYTAKVAGTEAGITEPVTTFSACFGAPFLPLHPTKYAEMLGKNMRDNKVNVWLVNTGWSGGPYGVGSRMSLKYTRAMINAALKGSLDNVDYDEHSIFGLKMPVSCPDVSAEILNPKNTWEDKIAYDLKAQDLAKAFVDNFEKYESKASQEIRAAAPRIPVNA